MSPGAASRARTVSVEKSGTSTWATRTASARPAQYRSPAWTAWSISPPGGTGKNTRFRDGTSFFTWSSGPQATAICRIPASWSSSATRSTAEMAPTCFSGAKCSLPSVLPAATITAAVMGRPPLSLSAPPLGQLLIPFYHIAAPAQQQKEQERRKILRPRRDATAASCEGRGGCERLIFLPQAKGPLV